MSRSTSNRLDFDRINRPTGREGQPECLSRSNSARSTVGATDGTEPIAFRTSVEYAVWVERLAALDRSTVVGLHDNAVARFAKAIGFSEPAPERRPMSTDEPRADDPDWGGLFAKHVADEAKADDDRRIAEKVQGDKQIRDALQTWAKSLLYWVNTPFPNKAPFNCLADAIETIRERYPNAVFHRVTFEEPEEPPVCEYFDGSGFWVSAWIDETDYARRTISHDADGFPIAVVFCVKE